MNALKDYVTNHLRLTCNTVNDLSNKLCVPNKAEDLNLSAFNMITGINKRKTIINYILCKSNVNLLVESVIQIKSGIPINVDASVKTR